MSWPSVEWLLKLLKNVASFFAVCHCLLWPRNRCYPLPWSISKNVGFIFYLLSWLSVALSQLQKRHEINVMSMAFSHETPRHLVKVTLYSPLISWQYCEGGMEVVCLAVLSAYDCLLLLLYTHWLSFRFYRLEICLVFIWIWHCCHWVSLIGWPTFFSVRTRSSYGVFFPFDVISEVISSFSVSRSFPYKTIPQPKQGASSMEDCLNLHGSNVGLQLGHWRVGQSYQPTGQINHLLSAWLPLYSAGSHCCDCPYNVGDCLLLNAIFTCFSTDLDFSMLNMCRKKNII